MSNDGYTFASTKPKNWYCSRRKLGCKAKIFLAADETTVVVYQNKHEHKPPKYTIKNGLWVSRTK